jgi:chemotaxis signal transduction protein
VDLSELKARLARAESEGLSTPVDRAALLRERGERYAARAPRRAAATPASARRALLLVALGAERLALDSAEVVAVLRRTAESPLPLAPEHVPFAMGFRGEPLLVVALSVLQGQGVPPPSSSQRVVVARWKAGRAGLLVDAALRVVHADGATVQPLAEHGWLPKASVEGTLPDGTVVLDVEGLARELSSGGKAP